MSATNKKIPQSSLNTWEENEENVFNRSSKTAHTPPNALGNSTIGYSCSLCVEPDNNEMVACDTCGMWFHYTCVNVTDDIANYDWNCRQCILKDKSATPRSTESHPQPTTHIFTTTATTSTHAQTVVEAKNASQNTAIRSSKGSSSKSSKSSSRHLKNLELKRLEEERILQLEYLNKKYAILQQHTESESEEDQHDDDAAEQSAKDHRVGQWIDTQQQRRKALSAHSAHHGHMQAISTSHSTVVNETSSRAGELPYTVPTDTHIQNKLSFGTTTHIFPPPSFVYSGLPKESLTTSALSVKQCFKSFCKLSNSYNKPGVQSINCKRTAPEAT